jgi:dolichol-phosphate mannosyltransferase
MSVYPRSEWVVPEFSVDLWRGRSSSACVVVPVINEGPRIGRLLARMAILGIPSIADIIVLDGGSTDGSLDDVAEAGSGVCGVLRKTGPGGLGAQLRCGYAFALDTGYEQIITIDGNDKDDPVAIPSFLQRLRSGYDFVQASRFVSGGVSENTPLSRWLAIRCIHAPVASLVSRFFWTDTTQGFRGYSRSMLLDNRLRIFRSCFDRYELLVYLSCRAPRYGFRCIELPTARRYPARGVPTKISPIRGNLSVLSSLCRASLGRLDP